MLAATMKNLKELEGGNKLHAMEVHRRQKMAIFVPVCRTLNKRSGACDCGTPHPLPGTSFRCLDVCRSRRLLGERMRDQEKSLYTAVCCEVFIFLTESVVLVVFVVQVPFHSG